MENIEMTSFQNNPICPKCESDDYVIKFYSPETHQGTAFLGWPEHLKVSCNVCGYEYFMEPADHDDLVKSAEET